MTHDPIQVKFTKWPHNRKEMPKHWILLLEDDADWQCNFLGVLLGHFGSQGKVLFVAAPSACFIPQWCPQPPIGVIVDHDMPWGHGLDAMKYLPKNLPICAASGIDANNDALVKAGATHIARKGDWSAFTAFLNILDQVIAGKTGPDADQG